MSVDLIELGKLVTNGIAQPEFEHAAWSYEGWVERYGPIEAEQIMQHIIASLFADTRAQDYEKYITSEEWRDKANEAKRRADYRCQVCYSQDRLEAHHRTYLRLGREDDGDITVLCHDCHELFSKNGRLQR